MQSSAGAQDSLRAALPTNHAIDLAPDQHTTTSWEFRRSDGAVRIDYRFTNSGESRNATLTTLTHGQLSTSFLGEMLLDLQGHQPTSNNSFALFTAALTTMDAEPYISVGFVLRSHLTLLTKAVPHAPLRFLTLNPFSLSGFVGHKFRHRHKIVSLDPDTRIVVGDQTNIPFVAEIDRQAFGEKWAMDHDDLLATFTATPKSCLHVAYQDQQPVGFVITGLAGRRGYLQRLAVHPDQQCRGIGDQLVRASTNWCASHRVRRVAVNTQSTNTTALRMYERAGFIPSSLGLVLLEHHLAFESIDTGS